MKKIIKRCVIAVIALIVITVAVVRIVILNSEGEKYAAGMDLTAWRSLMI